MTGGYRQRLVLFPFPLLRTKVIDHGLQRIAVTSRAKPADLAQADGRGNRRMAKGFSFMDIGDMDLDGRIIDGCEGIADGITVMGKSGGVEN